MRLRTIANCSFIVIGVFCLVCIVLYHKTETESWGFRIASTQLQSVDRPLKTPEHAIDGKNSSWNKNEQTMDIDIQDIYHQLKFDNPPGEAWKQGFPIQYNMDQWKDQPLEVFVVPHSHQDPGWLLTFDEYFEKQTRPCLDATLRNLISHPEARFIYAEISFFSKWVAGLSDQQKVQLKGLLQSGQWEITSGGWVMTDEATAHHYAMLDQLIEGHHWLYDTFGYLPNTSWAIDPFGHSPTMSYLARKMHLSGMVLQRVHYEVKRYLAERRLLEFHWRQPWDTKEEHFDLLATMLPFYSYDVPHTCGPDPAVCCQFDFSRLIGPRCPWKQQPQLITPRNVNERAQILADQYRKKSMLYDNGGIVLIPLGDDFRYLTDREWKIQLDNYNLLMKHINSKPEFRMKVRFATLSEYFKTLHTRMAVREAERQLKVPQFTGDLFTYADRDQDYWSGYFTTRPNEKALTRQLESDLRGAELLFSYARRLLAIDASRQSLLPLFDELYTKLTTARRSLALFQHHDGVTGTARQHVVDDYSSRMIEGIREARNVSSVSIGTLIVLLNTNAALRDNPHLSASLLKEFSGQSKRMLTDNLVASLEDVPIAAQPLEPMPLTMTRDAGQLVGTSSDNDKPRAILNLTRMNHHSAYLKAYLVGEHHSRLITAILIANVYLFNPLAHARTTYADFHFPYDPQSLQVSSFSAENPAIPTELPFQLESIGDGTSPKRQVTRLRVGPLNMRPMSLMRLRVQTQSTMDEKQTVAGRRASVKSGPSGESLADISLQSDHVELLFDRRTGLLKKFIDRLSGLHLDVAIDFVVHHTSKGKSHSGAYLFIPKDSGQPMTMPNPAQLRLVRGPLTEEIIIITPLLNHTVRLYKSGCHAVEIENTVDLKSQNDFELVMRIRTNISNTDRTFVTDSNCYQFIERRYHDKLPLQGNLYPMTCAAFIEAPSTYKNLNRPHVRLNLLSSFSHGVTSAAVGELSVWLDRRAPRDDDRGLERALVGDWVTESRFRLLVEQVERNTENTKYIPRLSLSVQTALDDLLRPVQRFIVDPGLVNQSTIQPIIELMPKFVLPNHYQLVNLKTFLVPTTSANDNAIASKEKLGLWLRHLGSFVREDSESSSSSSSLAASKSTDKLSVSSMFSSIEVTQAMQMQRITLIQEPDELTNWQSTIGASPMELEAFLLQI